MTTAHVPRSRMRNQDVARLAAAVVRIRERRAQLAGLSARLDVLNRGGIVPVSGDVELVTSLRQLLDRADATLAGLAAATDDSDALETLDGILGAVDWELADDLERSLPAKQRTHDQVGMEYRSQGDVWRGHLDRLRPKLDEATALNALVAGERDDFKILESLVMQADRAVAAGSYAEAATPLHTLRTRKVSVPVPRGAPKEHVLSEPEVMEAGVDVALARATQLAEHMELVILRTTPTDAERIEYVSILRVPRSAAGHAFSVRAPQSIARADFDHVCELTRRVGDAEGVRRGVRRHIVADPEVEPAARASEDVRHELGTLGRLLYQLVIPESIQDRLVDHLGPVTITTNEEELPWELVRIGKEHLCVRCPVARMPLGWTMPRIGAPRREGAPVRFLLLHADPDNNLQGATTEIEAIRAGLALDWGDRIKVETEEATNTLLNEALVNGEYDVVHYAGHARFDDKDPGNSGLLLSDRQIFPAEKCQRLIAGQPLVFLNACETSMTANETEKPTYLGHQAEGLSSAFLYGGAVACVGSRWPVFDKGAGEFAVTFYRHLLQGNMVGEALRLAREDSYAARGDEVTWATYTLYGDPGFHIATPGAAGAA